jgi:hypothetical protein
MIESCVEGAVTVLAGARYLVALAETYHYIDATVLSVGGVDIGCSGMVDLVYFCEGDAVGGWFRGHVDIDVRVTE